MSDERTRRYRNKRQHEQNQRCHYCGFPMWRSDWVGFARHFGISEKDAVRFRSTAEHLVALRDGGTSRQDNIVAACHFCNRTRHQRTKPKSAEHYREFVQRRIARRSWHPPHLFKMVGRGAPKSTCPVQQTPIPDMRQTPEGPMRLQVEADPVSLDTAARWHVEGTLGRIGIQQGHSGGGWNPS